MPAPASVPPLASVPFMVSNLPPFTVSERPDAMDRLLTVTSVLLMTSSLVTPPPGRTTSSVDDGTAAGFQFPAAFQSALTAPVQVFTGFTAPTHLPVL